MTRRAKKGLDPSPPSVPAYIVTFSDMITLLLTFFVLLISMAQEQDGALYGAARGAFIEHMNTYGLGMLMGKKLVPELGEEKAKYYIPDADKNTSDRTIDSKEERLRRLFQKAAESMQAIPSRINIRLSDYSITSIQFSPGQTKLNESAKKFLTQFASNFRQDTGSEKIELYVLALAGDEPTEKKQWITSSLRAQKVADYLETTGFKYPIYSWGAGSGGFWVGLDSPISQQSQLLIAVVRADDRN